MIKLEIGPQVRAKHLKSLNKINKTFNWPRSSLLQHTHTLTHTYVHNITKQTNEQKTQFQIINIHVFSYVSVG